MKTIEALLSGYDIFFEENFKLQVNPVYQELAKYGQAPKVMVISCSDSRVDPGVITRVGPGNLFVTRNIASLVPSYEVADRIDHGTIAVIEFGVCYLHVEDLVLIGHSQCGGIQALLNGVDDGIQPSFIPEWLSIAQGAKDRVLAELPDAAPSERQKVCTHEALGISMRNLLTYPWLKEAVDAGRLSLHTWYFDIDSGRLERLEKIG